MNKGNRHKFQRNHKKANSKAVQNSIDQKGHQEAQVNNEVSKDFENEKGRLEDQLQEYKYSQTSKFSSVSRNLTFGMMGTIWAIILNTKEPNTYHPCLIIALLLCIIYLAVDVLHYYTDSKEYALRQFELDKAKDINDLSTHNKIMDGISKNSQAFIKRKFLILCITVIIFLIGVIDNFFFSQLSH